MNDKSITTLTMPLPLTIKRDIVTHMSKDIWITTRELFDDLHCVDLSSFRVLFFELNRSGFFERRSYPYSSQPAGVDRRTWQWRLTAAAHELVLRSTPRRGRVIERGVEKPKLRAA